MPNRQPPPGLPLDLFRRAAELEVQLPRVLAQVHEQVRLAQELCRASQGMRLESEARRRAMEATLARR
jgi:hypothetical protein